MTQNQLMRSGTSCATSSTISPATPTEVELQAIEFGAKAGERTISGSDGARQHLRRQFRHDGRDQRAGAAQIRREFADARSRRATRRSLEALKEISALLEEYRKALARLIDNSKSIGELTARDVRVGHGDHEGRKRDEGRTWFPISNGWNPESNATHRRDRAPDPDARGRRLPARRGVGAAARQGNFQADDGDVQGDARTRRRQFRRRAAGPRAQGRTRRDGRRGGGIQAAGGRQGRTRCRGP